MTGSSNHVYVLGQGRSGSTILSKIISTHPRVFSAGEFFPEIYLSQPRMLCSCGEELENCEIRNFVLSSMNTHELLFLKSRASRIIDFKNRKNKVMHFPLPRPFGYWRDFLFNYSESMQYARMIQMIKERILEKYDRDLFFDASKQYYIYSLYRRLSQFDGRVIHLTRNPLGVFASNKRSSSMDVRTFVRAWNRNQRVVETIRMEMPSDNFLAVCFDSFVEDPENGLKEILVFLNLDIKKMGCYSGQVHILGNTNVRNSSSIELRIDNRWEKELSLSEINYINSNVKRLAISKR